MNPYLQAMLRRVHAQRLTPGGDEVMRPGVLGGASSQFWGAASDPRIFGAGKQTSSGWLGQPGSPVMPPQATPFEWDRQLPTARNVLRDLDRGVDPVLTGSGLEMTAEDYWRNNRTSVFDMLQQYLRSPGALGGGW